MKFTATLAIFAFTTSACCAGLTSSAPVDGEALERRTAIAVPATENPPPYCSAPRCTFIDGEGCRCLTPDKRSLSSPSIGEAHEKRTLSGPSRRSTNCPPGCLSLPGGGGYCYDCPKDPHDKRSTTHPNELPGRGPEKRSLLNGEALNRREKTASLATSDRLLLNRESNSPSIGEAHEKRTSSGPSRRDTNCAKDCLSLPGGYCYCPEDSQNKRSTAHPNELPGRGPEKRSLLNGEALKRREITASLASSDRLLLNRESNPPSVGDQDPVPPHFSCPKGCLYLPGLCYDCPGDRKVRRAIAPPIELPRRV